MAEEPEEKSTPGPWRISDDRRAGSQAAYIVEPRFRKEAESALDGKIHWRDLSDRKRSREANALSGFSRITS